MGIELEAEFDLGFELATSRKALDRISKLLEKPYSEKVFAAFSGQTNGAGLAGFRVYDIPDGKTFFLYKLIQWADGYTPAAPFANVNAWSGLYHGQASPASLADFAPYNSGGQLFPLTAEYGDGAPEFRQNDNVYFQVIAGPANTNITVMLFGELRDLIIRRGINTQELPVTKQRLK